jgi:starch-binding outer membrane protein, SusD/RagB family
MKLFKLIFSLSLLLTVFSCKKVIEIKETDLIEGATALKSIANNESAVIGAYAGFGIEMDILLNATMSDEMKTAGEFYNAQSTHEWLYTPTDIGIRDNFTAVVPQYRTIDRVNRVLQALPTAEAKVTGDEAKRSLLKGEALFLRAFCHFQLFRYYCSAYTATGLAMPYMEQSSRDPQTTQARINMATYFQKLNADIAAAKPLLPNNLTDKNRATLAAANALHARIALYTGDWANAEIYSTDFINAVPLSPIAQFSKIWTDSSTNEVAFQTIRTTTFRIGSFFRGTSANTSNIGVVTWKPTDKLWNSYDQVNDVRFASYLKNEPLLTTAGRQSRLINKYAGSGIATANENVNNAKIFRTGEMYLIRAEARAELNKFTGANSAESDINALGAARIAGYTNVTFATKTDAIDAIMQERFKELAFEGHRFWDLKRRNLPVQRIAVEAPTAASATLPAGDIHFLLPIPLTEMQANSAMTQNPGYN